MPPPNKESILPAEQIAVLSTRYITGNDARILTTLANVSNPGPLNLPRIESHRFGFILCVESDYAEICRAMERHGFSEALVVIYRLAALQGFSFVNFDRDGNLCEGLQEFDW